MNNNDLDKVLGGEQQPPVEPEQTGVDTPPEDNPTGETTPVKDDSFNNSTIRNMREELSNKDREVKETKAYLERVARSEGLSVEEYIRKLDENEMEQRAKSNKITPEIQRIIDEQNKKLSTFEEERLRVRFNANVNNLVKAHNLSEDEVKVFLNEVSRSGIDPVESPLSHTQLYYAFKGPEIISGLKEKIRQEVIEEINNKGSSAADINPGGRIDGDGKGSLDDAISAALKRP